METDSRKGFGKLGIQDYQRLKSEISKNVQGDELNQVILVFGYAPIVKESDSTNLFARLNLDQRTD